MSEPLETLSAESFVISKGGICVSGHEGLPPPSEGYTILEEGELRKVLGFAVADGRVYPITGAAA